MFTEENINTLKIIRGLFPDNLYIGGSKAFEYVTDLNITTDNSDIDIIIMQPRSMETWIILEFLENHFKTVEHKTGISDRYYLIEEQYLYINVYTDNIKYDLIFVDTYPSKFLENSIYSEFSAFLLKFNYINKLTKLNTSISRNALSRILFDRKIKILNKDSATELHKQKVKERAKKLELDLIL